jgi:hypothetical protein
MAESRNGGGSRIALVLVFGVILAIINAATLVRVVTGDWSALEALVQQGSVAALVATLSAQWQSSGIALAFLIASPVLLSLLAVLVHGGSQDAAAPAVEAVKVEAKKPGEEALRLLRALQEEARFVDFIQEDIDAYDDAQVGAAVRSIHAGCRKALAGRVTLRRIYESEEGEKVTVEAGFDPAVIRLAGNVGVAPPFSGTLQHAGWRAVEVRLPESPGGFDASVIAPAEVEIA